MQVRIDIQGDTEELLSLFRWLTWDPGTRRFVPVSLGDDGTGAEMGAGDFISAALTQATSIGTLATAIASWRESRKSARRSPSVRVVVHNRVTVITNEPAERVEEMLQSLCGFEQSADPTGDGR